MASRKSRRDTASLESQAATALADSVRALSMVANHNTEAVAAAAELLIACFEDGGTVYFCGNGGSAADAQHLAAEFSGRYLVDRPGLPAVALTANSSAVTAIGNDYGYDQVFSRQLEGCGQPGDVLVAITTSGRSASIRNAVRTAQELGMHVIGMTGAKGADFAAACDVALVTPTAHTPFGELFLPLDGLIDVEAEKVRLTKDLEKISTEIGKVEQKLANPAFTQKVPASVLQEHQQRLTEWQGKLAHVKAALEALAG